MSNDPTLKDIASELDLSISTVARALADHPQISEQTKARVRVSASAIGYVAHSAARSMRRGHSTLIGLIIPDVQNEFYGTLAKALAQSCDGAGYQLLLAITEDEPSSEERQVRALLEARVAGLVIVPSPRPTKGTLSLLKRGLWVQLIRQVNDGDGGPWFGIDEEAALQQATSYLLGLGHRKIAYIGGTTDLSTGRGRLRGFEKAFEAAGLAVPRHLIRLGRPRMNFATEAFREIWSSPDRPTAVVTGGSRLSAGVLESVGNLKLKMPEDVSVIGYGDAPSWYTGLSTIRLPAREIATACGEYLLRRIRDGERDEKDATALPYQAVHSSHFVPGGSTGSIATSP